MALVHYGTTPNTGTGSFSHDSGNGANRAIVVVSKTLNGSGVIDVTGVTYNGVALSELAAAKIQFNYTGARWIVIQFWYLANPASGSNTVASTQTSTPNSMEITASSWEGAKQSAPLGAGDRKSVV